MYYNSFFPFDMFGFGFLFMILFWVLVVYGIIYLFKKASSADFGKKEDKNEDRAMEILKERYAKGEITQEQFKEMKKDIK
jgi:putative membrane protein